MNNLDDIITPTFNWLKEKNKVAIAAVILKTSKGDSINVSEYRQTGKEWVVDHRRMLLGKRNLTSYKSKRSTSR